MQSYLPPELLNSRFLRDPKYRGHRRRLAAEIRAERRRTWERVGNAEAAYQRQLRALSRHVEDLIRSYNPTDPDQVDQMVEMLNRYAEFIEPWARNTAERMIEDVMRRDANAWFKTSREIGTNLRSMVETAPLGVVTRQLVADQTHLIKSLVTERAGTIAAAKAQTYVMDFVLGGRRYDELIDTIQGLGDNDSPITTNRARLIARTETGKAQAAIVQARAQYVGAEQYIWRTARDNAVRLMHRRLEGTVHRWDENGGDGPVAEENGAMHHPGNFPNCRCYAEPIVPAVIT